MRSLLLALLALVATVSSVGCSYRNEDINRVVQPYWAKAYFTDDNEWYARATVVDAPPEHGWVSIGDGDWLMLDKLRWEITENELIGWRTYASATGAENEQLPGGEEIYKGQAVARFKVTDHFDIRRDFDPTSGEQANTIGENRDRLWYDREFFRVDWSQNTVETSRGYINMSSPYGFNLVGTASQSMTYGSNEPAQPKRWRFEADPETGVPTYFEVTTRHAVEPDVAGLIGWYGALSYDTSSALIDVRYSFTRVPKSDYQPLAMPPTVILEDEDGKEVRDEKGFAVRIPINDRFGYFGSLGRASFDANRGMVSSGQLFNASRFNLWEKSVNDDGTVIPLEQRTPKKEAIVYYGNVEHPKQLLNASREVARQWNKAFRDTVYNINKARYTGDLDADGIPADVPTMFVFKENSCNVANVERVLADLDSNGHGDIIDSVTKEAARVTVNDEVVPFDGTIASVRARFDAANNGIDNMQANGLGPNGESFTQMQATESQALHDLERICAALEYFTGPDLATGRAAPEGVTQFSYQRLGDIRYSMMNLIVGDFQSGWLGLGPPYADPITGETISATANVAVGILDRGAARAAQMVQALNGENTELDFINGFDLKAYTNQKLLENSKLISRRASQQTKNNVARTFAALQGTDALREMAPGRAQERFSRLEGTEAEQKLVTNDDLALFGAVAPEDIASMSQTDALMEAASMVRNPTLRKLGGEAEARAIRMGNRAADAPEMIDSFMIGSALRYKDMSYAERFKKLREESYISVELHEVGHNTGLFHNFAGSTDAINYGPKFWELHNLPTDMNDALDVLATRADAVSEARAAALQNCIDAVDEAVAGDGGFGDFVGDVSTQECLTQSEGMYSSIMEYMGTWNSDFNGLGPYDFAANKFGYGQLLEVFPEENLADAQTPGQIKDRLFYDDWRTIPDLFVGSTAEEKAEKIQEREYVKMTWTTSSTKQAPLGNEVPYRFGPGNYPEPLVRVYDFGPDTRTNASYQLTRYYQHYYFSHFARNRLWDYDAVNGPLSSDAGIFDDFTQKMQWFFFLSATDPKFKGSYAEEDYLATTTIGMNHFAHVLAEPNSGDFSTLPRYQLFGTTNLRPNERDDAPLNVAIPWSNIDACTTVNINETDDVGTTMAGAKNGHVAGSIPLGEGRPFFVGFTDDYVDFYIRYVGHFWAKQYALIYLADSMAWFPRVDGDADFRTFDVGWYRLFPKEVAGIFSNLITQNDIGLGGYLDADGNYVRPDVVATDATPDTSSMTKVLPQIAFNHNYYAYVLANIYMSSTFDDTIDLPKMMQIAVDGGSDDVRAFDDAEARDAAAGCELSDDPVDPFDQYDDLTSPPACKTVLSFTHPESGLTYRALKVGETPIAFDLIKRLNVLKERFERLQTCGEQFDAGEEITDSYCACISSIGYARDNNNDLITTCTDGFASVMPGEAVTVPRSPALGGGSVEMTCDDVDLFNRIEGARESLDDFVDYVNDLRTYNKLINNF